MPTTNKLPQYCCPFCGASHYEVRETYKTLMYYEPIYENGVNVNPDRNVTTHDCRCLECGHEFHIRTRYNPILADEQEIEDDE